jgi:hypothetical protein
MRELRKENSKSNVRNGLLFYQTTKPHNFKEAMSSVPENPIKSLIDVEELQRRKAGVLRQLRRVADAEQKLLRLGVKITRFEAEPTAEFTPTSL